MAKRKPAEPIPARLLQLFQQQGFATLPQFCNATGIAYPQAIKLVQRGDLPATNVSSGSRRAVWRLYEEPVRQWFVERANKQPANDSPAVGDLPDYYGDDGQFRPPDGD